MLEAQNLALWRGYTRLFERLSFGVARGTALILRGPNGAGKTTLLRVLCGLTRPNEGEIRWEGQAGADALRGNVAYLAHQPGLSGDLTIRQNLEFFARVSGGDSSVPAALAAVGLAACADLEVRYLSAGQKRRAAIARVLLAAVPVWLLDEPFTNLDDTSRRMVEQHVGAHLEKGGLAVIAAHDAIFLGAGRSSVLAMGDA